MHYRVDVLGPFRVVDPHGQEVQITGQRPRALLAHLALEPQGADREALARLLWPNADASAARQSLRQALSTVRRALGADPFLAGDRVGLDTDVCRTDVAAFEDAIVAGDFGGALALVRGQPLSGVDVGVSQDLEEWAYLAEQDLLARLARLIEAEAAASPGDVLAIERLHSVAVRAGLDPQVVRATLPAVREVLPPWVGASVGPDALRSMVYRQRRSNPPTAALVVEEVAGWCADTVRAALDDLHGKDTPHLLAVAPDCVTGSDLLRAVLEGLLKAPGGAAVRTDTVVVLDLLRSRKGWDLGPDFSERLRAALFDAFDAVLEEVPLVVLAPAVGIDPTAAEALAGALTLQGGEGLGLVVFGRAEHGLDTSAIRSLVAAFRTVHRVCSHPPDPPHPTQAVTPRRRWALPAGGLVAALLASLGWAWSSRPLPPSALLPDHDILLCSVPSGAPWYFRYSPSTGVIERLTSDPAPTDPHAPPGTPVCKVSPNWLQTGDSVYLAVEVPVGLEWRAYVNRESRLDLTGQATWVAAAGTGETFTQDHFVLQAREAGRHGVILVDLATGRTEELTPQGWVGAPTEIGHAPPWWLLQGRAADGNVDLYRVNSETRVLQRLTSDPLDEATGILRGDSLLFARGRTGDAEDGGLELFLLDIASGTEEQLTDNHWNDHDMRWSADGRHICWTSEELGHFQSEVMVMDLVGRRSWNLSRSPGRDYGCWFTPDGSGVLYESLRNENRQLIVHSLDRGEGVPIPTPPGTSVFIGFVDRVK